MLPLGNVIIVGDFNAKHTIWGSKISDNRGKIVELFLECNNLTCLNNGEATRLNYNGTISHLDLVLCSNKFGPILDFKVGEDSWGSDHYPIFSHLRSYSPLVKSPPVNMLDYNKADWNTFSDYLHNFDQSQPIKDASSGYEILTNAYTRAIQKSIPSKQNVYKHKYSPFWNDACKNAKLSRKVAEKNLRKCNSVNNIITYKLCKAAFKKTLMAAKIKYWENYCNKINHQTKLKYVWNKIRELKNLSFNNSNINIKNADGALIDDQSLADEFAVLFRSVHHSSDLQVNAGGNDSRSYTVNDYCDQLEHYKSRLNESTIKDSLILNDKFSLSELEDIIKTVNIKSSPGPDGISYNLYRHSPPKIIMLLLNTINLSWEQNSIPSAWKHATVKPILKVGKNKNDINSYRPIALTNTISKLMEKLIVKRLSWYLEKHNLLNPSQSGFRKFRSTCDPVIRLLHEADISVKSGNITIGILIDFSKAFDLLWIDGLLLKMMGLNITGRLLNWTKNFLTNRSYRVKIGDALSSEYSSINGTPQGSAYSPLLFLIMVNDFPLLSPNTSEGLFADDCTVWRSGMNIETVYTTFKKTKIPSLNGVRSGDL